MHTETSSKYNYWGTATTGLIRLLISQYSEVYATMKLTVPPSLPRQKPLTWDCYRSDQCVLQWDLNFIFFSQVLLIVEIQVILWHLNKKCFDILSIKHASLVAVCQVTNFEFLTPGKLKMDKSKRRKMSEENRMLFILYEQIPLLSLPMMLAYLYAWYVTRNWHFTIKKSNVERHF